MSQIPTEYLLSAPGRLSRSASPDSTGQTIGVGYGSADMPMTNQVHSQGEQLAQQLEGALSGLGGAVARYGAIKQHATDVQNALDEKSAHLADVLHHGQGVQDARAYIAKLHDDVTNGRTPYPGSSGDVPRMTDGGIRDETKAALESLGGADTPAGKAYLAGFRAQAEVPSDNIWYGALNKNKQIITTETLSRAADSAIVATSKDDMDKLALNLKESGLNLSDDEIKHTVGVSAMTAAAKSGDAEKFKIADEFLGGRFADIPIKLQPVLDSVIQKRQNEANQTFIDDVSARAISGTDQDENHGVFYPYSVQKQMARQRAGELNVPEHILKQALIHIDTQEKADLQEAHKQQVRTDLQTKMDQYRGEVYSHLLDAKNGGGLATINMDEEVGPRVTDLNGTEHKVPIKEFVTGAINKAMVDLNPNVSPLEMTRERANYLNDNNAVYQPMQAVARAGANISPISVLEKTKDGRPNIGANSIAGLKMYQQMMAYDQTGILASRIIGDPKAERFYEAAEMSRKWAPQGATPEEQSINALASTATRMYKVEPLSDESVRMLRTQVAENLNTGIWPFNTNFNDAKNATEVRGETIRLARYFAQTGSAPLEEAAKEAAKKVMARYQIVNGWAVDMGNNSLPTNPQDGKSLFPAYADKFIDQYMKTTGTKLGIDRDRLSVIPAGSNNAFYIFDRGMYQPVPEWRDKGMFTVSDIWKDFQTIHEKQSAADAVERANIINRIANPPKVGSGPAFIGAGGNYGPNMVVEGYSGPATGYK